LEEKNAELQRVLDAVRSDLASTITSTMASSTSSTGTSSTSTVTTATTTTSTSSTSSVTTTTTTSVTTVTTTTTDASDVTSQLLNRKDEQQILSWIASTFPEYSGKTPKLAYRCYSFKEAGDDASVRGA
jgi:hypothetical protein